MKLWGSVFLADPTWKMGSYDMFLVFAGLSFATRGVLMSLSRSHPGLTGAWNLSDLRTPSANAVKTTHHYLHIFPSLQPFEFHWMQKNILVGFSQFPISFGDLTVCYINGPHLVRWFTWNLPTLFIVILEFANCNKLPEAIPILIGLPLNFLSPFLPATSHHKSLLTSSRIDISMMVRRPPTVMNLYLCLFL